MLDKKTRLPRVWSNKELKKFAHFFYGDVVNVSAWKDIDKEGKYYKDYFCNANSYTLTNYKADARGFQGNKDEIFLDLEEKLPDNLVNKFDVVFNHTTLEHIYKVQTAFKNLCLLSKDIVIVVVPFLQNMHGEYGDYWRFTPLTIKRMFENNNLEVLYSSFNEHRTSSVYLFFIASKKPNKWKDKIHNEFNYVSKYRYVFDNTSFVGNRAIKNSIFYYLINFLKIKLWRI